MKALALLVLLSSTLHASIETLSYKILPGKLHTGGTLDASVLSTDEAKDIMEVLLKYDIIKKPFVPAPADLLKSSMTLELPLEFLDERGYLNLEMTKLRDMEKATLHYVGRVDIGKFKNAHHVRILNKKGKFECDVYYHPSMPELGWPEMRLILNVSILSNYEVKAELK
jgi:hypothetical protein